MAQINRTSFTNLFHGIGTRIPFRLPDGVFAAASAAGQLILAPWFGHYYDDRVFLAAGYLVAAGHNPYQAQDLSAVFQTPAFQSLPAFGYPPPWALVLGIIYRLGGGIGAGWYIYNLTIKLPIIASNIGIAYLAGALLRRLGAAAPVCRSARIFLLASPFLFYFGAAWGQFDSLVAFLSLAAVLLLDDGKPGASGLALALAVSFKPTALPILPVFLLYWMGKSLPRAIRFAAFFAAGIAAFCFLPFFLFGWNYDAVLEGWNYHFTAAGAMGWGTVYSLSAGSDRLTGAWELLGWLWVPALAVGTYCLRSQVRGLKDVVRGGAGMVLIFFLTRSWLSEPNVVLLLPFAAVLAYAGSLSSHALAAIWIIPFVFTAWNNSAPQLLFPILKGSMGELMRPAGEFRIVQSAALIAVIAVWQTAGWRILTRLIRPAEPSEGHGTHPAAV